MHKTRHESTTLRAMPKSVTIRFAGFRSRCNTPVPVGVLRRAHERAHFVHLQIAVLAVSADARREVFAERLDAAGEVVICRGAMRDRGLAVGQRLFQRHRLKSVLGCGGMGSCGWRTTNSLGSDAGIIGAAKLAFESR